MPRQKRRGYGEGSVFQRCEKRYGCPPLEQVGTTDQGQPVMERPDHACAGRWYATIEAGWNSNGTRRRITVSAKTEAEARRRHRRKKNEIEQAGHTDVSDRTTVKVWAEEYLELRKLPPKPLSPNGWNAAATPIRKWIIPTIGHKRLNALTPADVRAVAMKHYEAGLKTSTADATQRAMMTMLHRAIAEGHRVPEAVMRVDRPGMSPSDRTALSLEESLLCLAEASKLPHGIRWVFALLYGARQGEVLGLHDDEIDWDNKLIRLEWQLQDLQREHGCVNDPTKQKPRCGKLPRSCPVQRYRVPRDYEVQQLVGMYHLVRPKSKKGYRTLPMIPAVEKALKKWLKERPENEWGLVFPAERQRLRKGKVAMPTSDKDDRAEFLAIQERAGVSHPSGKRAYHVHECRNFFATQGGDVGMSDKVLTELIGHASIRTTRGYQAESIEAKRQGIEALAERLVKTGVFSEKAPEETQSPG